MKKILYPIFSFFALSFLNLISSVGFSEPSLTCKKSACFEPSLKISEQILPLRNAVLLEYLKFDFYTAALYAPPGFNTPEQILNNVPKSLILYYHRTVKKEWMIKASRDRIKKNPANHPSDLEGRLLQLDAAYRTVKKGDHYELRYEPGVGTSLILNGQLQATISGDDFQRAFFGIWLSDLPLNKNLRDQLINPKE